MATADNANRAPEGKCLHLRSTWSMLPKSDTLMLHDEANEGSFWLLSVVPGTALVTIRCRRSDRYLHVRETWNYQSPENALMVCQNGASATARASARESSLHRRSNSNTQTNIVFFAHSGAGDAGSHWQKIAGPMNTVKLWNERSGCYLSTQAMCCRLCAPPKGNQLMLSPDPNTPSSLWFADQASDGWSLLRSFAATLRDSPNQTLGAPGRKFSESGAWQDHAGFSVVADVLPSALAELAHGRELVSESLAGMSILSNTLPLESLHMTVDGHDCLGSLANRQAVR